MGTDTVAPTQFADFILARRQELGLTLRQLQDTSGIDNSRLSRWERGLKLPDSPDRLPALARALDVPASELYARLSPELAQGLPHLRPYLHTKYGSHVPHDTLHQLARYCEEVLAAHGVHPSQPAVETVPIDDN